MQKKSLLYTDLNQGNSLELFYSDGQLVIENAGLECLRKCSSTLTLQDAYKSYFNRLEKHKNITSGTVGQTIHSGTGYISMEVAKESADRIFAALFDLDIHYLFDPNKYHFTLQYDKSNPIIAPQELPKDTIYKATVTGVKILAPNTENAALAFIFESSELKKRFDELLKMGFKYDYPEFIAHCSIKYLPTDEDYEIVKNNIDTIIDKIGTIDIVNEKWRKAKS